MVGSHVLGGTVVYSGHGPDERRDPDQHQRSAAATHQYRGGQAQSQTPTLLRWLPQLQKLLPEGTLAMTSPPCHGLEKRFWSNETPIGFLFDLGALIGFLISGIYIYQVLFQIVDENLAEYAVLKSMGYPNSFFTVLVVCTATILALAAIPPAVAVSFIVYEICVAATLLDLELTTARVLGGRRAHNPDCDLVSLVCQASIASHRSSSLDVGPNGIPGRSSRASVGCPIGMARMSPMFCMIFR